MCLTQFCGQERATNLFDKYLRGCEKVKPFKGMNMNVYVTWILNKIDSLGD